MSSILLTYNGTTKARTISPTSSLQVSTGLQGPPGPAGLPGPAGVGVPAGGTAGQILTKIDNTNYNTGWSDPAGAGVLSFNTRTGAVTLQSTDVVSALGYTPYNSSNPAGYITALSLPSGANPSASVGLTAVNGVAPTYMRSDSAPSLSQAIVPTWTGVHTFANQINITGNRTLPAWGANGAILNISAFALTDNNSPTGTVATNYANTFAKPTLNASNTGVIYTVASTLYIDNAPVAGTNVTITNNNAIYVANGQSTFNGGLSTTLGALGNGANFYASPNTTFSSSGSAAIIFGGASSVAYRSGFYGSTSSALATGQSYSNVVVASAPVTTFTTATHSWLVNLMVNPIGAVTNAGAAVSNTASLYVNGAGSGGSSNWAMVVASGNALFSGPLYATGGFQSNATASQSNFAISGSTNIGGTTTQSTLLFGGASAVQVRALFGGITSTALASGSSYSNVIVASAPVTTFTSATHTWLANLVVTSLGTVTNAGATVTNTTGVYLQANTTGGTNNYTMYSSGGNIRFDGNFGLGSVFSTTWFSISAGTTAKSQMNLTTGVAPTTPVSGDIYRDANSVIQIFSDTGLRNATAATVGVQTNSPALVFEGQGWKTTATAASQSVRFQQYVLPVQGAANPGGQLIIASSVNAASYTTALTVDLGNGNGAFVGIGAQTAPICPIDINYTIPVTSADVLVARFVGTNNLVSGNRNSYMKLGVGGAVNAYWDIINDGGGILKFNYGNSATAINTSGFPFSIINDGRANHSGSLYIGTANTYTSAAMLGFTGSTTAKALMNLTVGVAPTSPNDGDVWREDNTNTGFKIRVNGVTKTITLS